MKKGKIKKVLFIGDGVVPTGFSSVLHNIISRLPKNEFDIHHLAINYYGDPHDKKWKIYPAVLGGDIWGYNRIKDFVNQDFDGIFILNDPWVIHTYLKVIKDYFKDKIPPIVVYFPVDARALDADWFTNYDIVSKVVVYTTFGQSEVLKISDELKPTVIFHGISKKDFYKITDKSLREIKKEIYPDKEEFLDSFIVLNANRNQPRKRVDLTLLGFKLFAEDKPENVKLYMHMGVQDMGWNLFKLSGRYGLDSKLIVTNTNSTVQAVPIQNLNLIYNGTDVGINTALGEGWSLTNMEHAVSGKPQLVPDHSALHELYSDCGLLMPISMWHINSDTLTVGGIVSPETVASGLQKLYENKQLYDTLAEKSLQKFTSPTYDWNVIVKNDWIPLLKETYEHNVA